MSMRLIHRQLPLLSALAFSACFIAVPKIFASPDYQTKRPAQQPRTIDQQLKLASNYLAGRGVAQNLAMAAYWYQKAAEAGDPQAQTQIGYFYDAGIGVSRDPALAAHWYQLAASGGYARAKASLGIMYLWGTGVTKDEHVAAQLFREAANQGSGLAACYLGHMYRLGLGVPQDSTAAERWYFRGATLHDPQAEYNLAVLQLSDPGHSHGPHDIAALLRASAADGYVPAIHTLGQLLARNPTLAKSPAEAGTWLNSSADAGVWQSSLLLGVLSRDGRGVPADPAQAYFHFRVAALQGGPVAEKVAAYDLQKLSSALGSDRVRSLDEQAQDWFGHHRSLLEFVDQEHDRQTRFPAFALAVPQDGAHTLQLIPPMPN